MGSDSSIFIINLDFMRFKHTLWPYIHECVIQCCVFLCLLQYYDDSFPTLKEQTKFEESLFNKTRRSNGTYIIPISPTLSSSVIDNVSTNR